MNGRFVRNAAVIGALAILFAASSAQAVILNPGDLSTDIPAMLLNAPTGNILASNLQTVVTPGGDVATLLTAVVQDTVGGTLDFLYQWTAGANNLDQFQLNSAITFGGFTTDVGWIKKNAVLTPALTGLGFVAAGFGAAPGFTVPTPDTVKRSTAPGNTIDWVYPDSDLFHAGDQSVILMVRTNATAFTTGTAGIQDGTTANANSFSPAVPEPMSLLVWLGVGSLAMFFVRRRR